MNTSKDVTLIRLPAVLKKVGFSRPTINRKVKDGTFPRPKKIGLRAVAWIESDVDEWIENLESA